MSRGSSGHVSHVTSIRGSHEQLIKLGGITVDKSAWSNMTGFVSASLGMTLNHHSLYLLPLSIIRHGGLSFLLLYSALVILLGAPLVLSEMFLGQFSSLPCVQMYYNLCPLLSGKSVNTTMYCEHQIFDTYPGTLNSVKL